MADIRRKGKISVEPGQPPKDAVLMEVMKADEKWSVYDLDDGTQIRIRPAVIEVWRIENEFDADGNPAYVFRAQTMLSTLAPETLKRRPAE